nr:AIF_HP1_G0030580.mRNA.1.CDS.1 [Saccharomyces cerevisiae]
MEVTACINNIGFASVGVEDVFLECIGFETDDVHCTPAGGTKDSSIDDIDELIQDMEIKEEDATDSTDQNCCYKMFARPL